MPQRIKIYKINLDHQHAYAEMNQMNEEIEFAEKIEMHLHGTILYVVALLTGHADQKDKVNFNHRSKQYGRR